MRTAIKHSRVEWSTVEHCFHLALYQLDIQTRETIQLNTVNTTQGHCNLSTLASSCPYKLIPAGWPIYFFLFIYWEITVMLTMKNPILLQFAIHNKLYCLLCHYSQPLPWYYWTLQQNWLRVDSNDRGEGALGMCVLPPPHHS